MKELTPSCALFHAGEGDGQQGEGKQFRDGRGNDVGDVQHPSEDVESRQNVKERNFPCGEAGFLPAAVFYGLGGELAHLLVVAQSPERVAPVRHGGEFSDGLLPAQDFLAVPEGGEQPLSQLFPPVPGGRPVDGLKHGVFPENVQVVGVGMGGVLVLLARVEAGVVAPQVFLFQGRSVAQFLMEGNLPQQLCLSDIDEDEERDTDEKQREQSRHPVCREPADEGDGRQKGGDFDRRVLVPALSEAF